MLKKFPENNLWIHFYILQKEDVDETENIDNYDTLHRVLIFLRDPAYYGSHIEWVKTQYDKSIERYTDEMEELINENKKENDLLINKYLKSIKSMCEFKNGALDFYKLYNDNKISYDFIKSINLPAFPLILDTSESLVSFFGEFGKELMDPEVHEEELLPFFKELKNNNCKIIITDPETKESRDVLPELIGE
jgi:hypothetical protein